MSIFIGSQKGLVQIRSTLWRWTSHHPCLQCLGSQAEQGRALSHHPRHWAPPWGQGLAKVGLESLSKCPQKVECSLVTGHIFKYLLCHWSLFKNQKGPTWSEMAAGGPALGATCWASPLLSPSCDWSLGTRQEGALQWKALLGMIFSKKKSPFSAPRVKILHCNSWEVIQSKISWRCLQG